MKKGKLYRIVIKDTVFFLSMDELIMVMVSIIDCYLRGKK